MNRDDSRVVWVGMSVTVALVGGTMLIQWNADGPGTNAGGNGAGQKIDEPEEVQLAKTPREQRRRERAAISGAVRDVEGGPIAGAMVCAVTNSTLLGADDTRWPRCALSGPGGRYRIEDLFGVRQRVSAGAAGHLPADHMHASAGVGQRAIDLRPGGEARDVDVMLLRGGVEIRGVVRDLQGEPLAGAWVASGESESDTGISWARSGADGGYTLSVRPGAVTVTAQATGHVKGNATGPSSGPAFEVYLAPSAVLRGKAVRADDGEPIDGAWVRLGPGGETVRADHAGHFRFDALPPGVYTPRVEADDGFGMAAEQVSLGLGETSALLTIAVHPAAFVEGRILIADGDRACDEGSLTLRDEVSGRESRDASGPDGLVHVRGLLAGTYTVQIACDGAIAADRYPPVIVRDQDVLGQVWQVAPGRKIDDTLIDALASRRPLARSQQVVATKTLARAITGVLRDAQGHLVAGALVEARPAEAAVTGESWHVGGGRPQLTDKAGRFTLAGLTGAAYTITAQRIGGGAARREHVKRGALVALALVPTGHVTGTVVEYGGGVPDSFVIDLVEVHTGQHHREDFIGTAGAWGFNGLPHGSYEVHVLALEGTSVQALEVTTGETHARVKLELMGATPPRRTALAREGPPVPIERIAETAANFGMLRGMH